MPSAAPGLCACIWVWILRFHRYAFQCRIIADIRAASAAVARELLLNLVMHYPGACAWLRFPPGCPCPPCGRGHFHYILYQAGP